MSSSSSSESDLDVEDAQMMLMATSSRKKKNKTTPSRSRRAQTKRAKVIESEDEEGDSSDDEVFHHKYNEDLVVDEEDRKYLESLTELEREMELNRRNEEREKAKRRWEMEREMKRKARRKKGPTQRKTRSAARQEKAAAQLMSSDEEKEDHDETQPAMELDDESDYADELGDNRLLEAVEEVEEDVEAKDETPASMEQLETIRVTRRQLLDWCHERHFPETVAGMMVRINLGEAQPGVSTYRLGQIVCVEEKRLYEFRDRRARTKTKYYMLVQHGRSRRPFRMTFVSNGPILHKEYLKWKQAIEKDNASFPTVEDVTRKQKELAAIKDRVRTGEDIIFMIESKRRCNCATTNIAREIDQLKLEQQRLDVSDEKARASLQQHRQARQDEYGSYTEGDEEDDGTARGLKEELSRCSRRKTDIADIIDRLERQKESEAQRRRANMVVDTNKLNERNIRAEKLERARMQPQSRNTNDVLSRRDNYSKTRAPKPKKPAEEDGGTEPKQAAEASGDKASSSTEENGPNGDSSDRQASKQPEHATDLHDFHVEGVADLPEIDVEAALAPAASLATPSMPAPVTGRKSSVKKSGRRGLNLKDYKKKHGLV